MIYEKMNQRYHHDPEIATVVHALMNLLERAQLTPAELREVAMYAAVRFEQTRLRPIFMNVREAEALALDQVRKAAFDQEGQ